jgi:ABC-type transporter Mla subunit MlaD
MQILRSEIRTGILVILTIGLLVGVVLYLSTPGIFRPLVHYRVYFDDAAAIKPGAEVTLAGRKIGTVYSIKSPVPMAERPAARPDLEAVITVQVSADAEIFKDNSVTMRSFGLLAEPVIDFTRGDPNSGRAVAGDSFVGVRSPDLSEVGPAIIQKLTPTLTEATSTLTELHRTAENLTRITAKDSRLLTSLDTTLDNFRVVGANLEKITEKGGSVDQTLTSVQTTLTGVQTTLKDAQGLIDQAAKDNHIGRTLANFDAASVRLKSVLGDLQGALNADLPRAATFVSDLSDVAAKLKEQPWRIIWPNTIKYPESNAPTPLKREHRERTRTAVNAAGAP